MRAPDLKYPPHAFEAWKAYGESMKSAMGNPALAKSSADLVEKMKAIKGVPVATTMIVDAGSIKMTSESEVTEVRRGSIPASTWEVPAGYTKIENPMLKAMGRRPPRPQR